MKQIAFCKDECRYAVQGDLSDCNLYLTAGGEIGVFDFNNSGDHVLYYDAVMQAVFEATLMDYEEAESPEREQKILSAFLNGYDSIRPFTDAQKEVFPYFYAIITAFERGKMCYRADNLNDLIIWQKTDEIRICMDTIYKQLLDYD